MMHWSKQRGFTLIELLVVISIIGFLSTVVLAALSQARIKGANANIRTTLANARAEAEIFYDNTTPSSYTGVCALTGTNVIGGKVQNAENVYDGLAGAASYNLANASRWDNGQCHENGTAWAAWIPLRGSTSGSIQAYCVDNTGAGRVVSSILLANAVTCP